MTVKLSYWMTAVLGVVIGVLLTLLWQGRAPLPVLTIEEIDRPPTKKELEVEPLAPSGEIRYAPAETTYVACVEAPEELVAAETGFDLIPRIGAVSLSGDQITLRRFDTLESRWVFQYYNREPANAWYVSAGGAVFPGFGMVYAGIERRRGDTIWGIGPAYSTLGAGVHVSISRRIRF